jgi:hypothetical protein
MSTCEKLNYNFLHKNLHMLYWKKISFVFFFDCKQHFLITKVDCNDFLFYNFFFLDLSLTGISKCIDKTSFNI